MNSDSTRLGKNIAGFLVIFGLAHALVDAACAFIVLGLPGSVSSRNIVLYNVLAFGLQAPFGLVLDRYTYPKQVSFSGILLLFSAFLCIRIPMLAVILAGTGNALFHIGGGQVALSINHKKAVYAGIYVAPGGIGLAAGIYLSLARINLNPFVFPVLLLLMGTLVILNRLPSIEVVKKKNSVPSIIYLIIAFIILSISIRSVIGLTIMFPWKQKFILLVIITLSIALGKVLGGVFSDRFGLLRTGLTGLLIAMPMLAFGANIPVIGIAGIFAFNLTMPVTLVAISKLLPGRAAFAFGLSTLALLIGAIPSFFSWKQWFNNEWVILSFIMISAFALFAGLFRINKHENS